MASGEPASALADAAPLRHVRIVLVRPRGAGNVGAAARAAMSGASAPRSSMSAR